MRRKLLQFQLIHRLRQMIRRQVGFFLCLFPLSLATTISMSKQYLLHQGGTPRMYQADDSVYSEKQSGEAGIRTLGTRRLNGFRDRPIRPLWHLSGIISYSFLSLSLSVSNNSLAMLSISSHRGLVNIYDAGQIIEINT